MKQKKSSFRGKVSKNAQSQATAGNNFGYLNLPKGFPTFSPEPGKRIKMDILPYEVKDAKHPDRDPENEIAMVGDMWYRRPFITHRSIGANHDSVVCLASIGKKCPICEYRAKLQKNGADKETLAALKQSRRVLYLVVPLDSDKHEKKPHVFDMSHYNFQELLNDELDENPDYEVFPDLEEGLSIKVRWNSETMGAGKPFAQAGKITFEERTKPYKESILNDTPNLDEILKILSYAELEAKFLEVEGEEDPEKEEEEEDKPKRGRKTAEKPKEKEPEEDLADLIDEADTTAELIELAEENTDIFDKKMIVAFKKIKKVDALKEAMTEALENAEPEEEPEKEEEPDDSLTWDDLENMKVKELKNLVKANDLDTDPDDYDDDIKSLRKAIAKELEIEIPKAGKK